MSTLIQDRLRRPDEAGFTLPELLISIGIVTLIMGALTAALILVLRLAGPTSGRYQAANDTQLAANYFSSDAASTQVNQAITNGVTNSAPNGTTITAQSSNGIGEFTASDVGEVISGTNLVTSPPTTITKVINSTTAIISQAATQAASGNSWSITWVTYGPTASTCSDAGQNPRLVVGFSWLDSAQPAAESKYADWVTEGNSLVRLYCTAPGPFSKKLVLSQNLDLGSPPSVLNGTCPATTGTCSLQVDELTKSGATTSHYEYTLTGTPRTFGSFGSYSPVPPLLVLCTTNCIQSSDTCQDTTCHAPAGYATPNVTQTGDALDLNDNSFIYVVQGNGVPYDPTSCFGSSTGNSGCPPVGVIDSGANAPASGTYAAAVTEASGVGAISNGTFQPEPIDTLGGCYATTSTSGQWSGPSQFTCDPINQAIPDPFGPQAANLNPLLSQANPTAYSALTPYASEAAACTTATNPIVCHPGIYNFEFIVCGTHTAAAPFCPNTAVPTTLTSGVYVLNDGMQLGTGSGNVTLNSGPGGVLLDLNSDGIPSTCNAGINGHNAQICQNAATATVNLSPLDQSTCGGWCYGGAGFTGNINQGYAGITVFAPKLPQCPGAPAAGCWTYSGGAPVTHYLDMFASGAIYTQGVLYAPWDAMTSDNDTAQAGFTQVDSLVVGSIHIGIQATLEVGGGSVINPSISTITPNYLGQGANAATVTVVGSNIEAGAEISFCPGAPNSGNVNVNGACTVANSAVTAQPAMFNSGTGQLSAPVTVAGNAQTGAWTLIVTNVNTTFATGAFTVYATPTITPPVSPPAIAVGVASAPLTIQGTGFLPPNQAGTTPPDLGATVTSNTPGVVFTVTSVSPTQIVGTVSSTGASVNPAGTLTVDNQDSGTKATVAFPINPDPTITSMSPNPVGQGYGVPSQQLLTILGTNFEPGAAVSVPPGAGVTLGATTVVSPTMVTVPIKVFPSATPGSLIVTLTNPDLGTATSVLTIDPGPTISSIVPTSVRPGASVTMTVTGTNFVSGLTLAVAPPNGLILGVPAVTSTSITVTVTAPIGAAIGAETLTVTNPDGGNASGTFRVANANITLTPQSGVAGQTVTVTGSSFANNAALTATFDGAPLPLNPIVPLTNASGSFGGVTFIVPNSTTGNHTVAVTDGTFTGSATFSINTPSAILTPSSGGVGNTITISGSSFPTNSTITATWDGANLPLAGGVPATTTTGGGAIPTPGPTFSVPLSSPGPHAVIVSAGGQSAPAFTFTVSPATQLVIITPPYTGLASSSATLGPITVQLEDGAGNPVFPANPVTVTLSTSSPATGLFAATSGGSALSPAQVTITTGSSTASFYYGDIRAGTPTMTAASGGLHAATQQETINPGPATQLLVSGNTDNLPAGNTRPITATIEDQFGNTVTSGPDSTDLVTFTLVPGGSGSVTGLTSINATAGVATDTVTGGAAGFVTIQAAATVNGSPLSNSISFNVVPGTATQLVFTTPPGDGQSSLPWSTQPVVSVEDAGGNLVTGGPGSNASITLAINFQPGTGATIGCTGGLTAVANAGVAQFSGCEITGKAGIYTISASATLPNGPTNTVASFNITAGPASQLVFTAQPGGAASGSALGTQPSVTIEDSGGNQVTNATNQIALAINGHPTGSGTLACNTNPLGATGGMAAFTGCEITGKAGAYTLNATSAGLTTATSNPFTITAGPAAQLAFTRQPAGAASGSAFGTQPQVSVEDANGNLVTSGAGATASITLSIASPPANGATLTCNQPGNTLAATGGVANFTGCRITGTTGSYTLSATSAGLTTASSNPFNLTFGSPTQVALSGPTGTLVAGSPGTLTATIEDSAGNPVTNATNQVMFAQTAGTGSANGLPATVTAVNGVANQAFSAAKRGTVSTQATSAGLTASNTVTFTVAAGAASQLVFTTQPGGGPNGTAWTTQPSVSVEDVGGNVITSGAGSNASITLSIGSTHPTPAGAPSCTTNPLTAVNGVANFLGCQITGKAGTYTLSAAGGGFPNVTSAPFTITFGAATQLAFTTQPGGGNNGQTWNTQPVVTVEDASGNTVTAGAGSNAQVTLAINTHPASGTGNFACSTNPVTAAAGVASFNGCRINNFFGAYTLKASATGFTTVISNSFNA